MSRLVPGSARPGRCLAIATLTLSSLALVGACSGSAAEPQSESSATEPETTDSSGPIILTPASMPSNKASTTDDATTNDKPTIPAHVAVVGDSLTVASQTLIDQSLRSLGVNKVVIDGIEGRRMTGHTKGKPPGIDAVEAIIESGFEPDLWVIELGTNDVGAQVQPDAFRADMEAILAMLPSEAHVVWVNVHLGRHDDATDEANEIIRRVARSRPNTSVADWHERAVDMPELLTDDGVHLRKRGEMVYSLVISNAVVDSIAG